MTPYFSESALQDLRRGRREVNEKFVDLRQSYILRRFDSDKAREYAHHGFGRRLGDLIQAIDVVFESLPPENHQIPERESVTTATIAIQSFVLNTFGCLDNLAWIWVHEKNVTKAGKALDPRDVGLGRNFKCVRQSFSQEFRNYLDSREKWFDNLKGFRDALAHRIPLYIPPYVVHPKSLPEFERLEQDRNNALLRADFEEYERLEQEQMKLAHFRPWMTHSRSESSPVIVFHAQLIQDFLTVDECGRMLLDELNR